MSVPSLKGASPVGLYHVNLPFSDCHIGQKIWKFSNGKYYKADDYGSYNRETKTMDYVIRLSQEIKEEQVDHNCCKVF